MKRYITLLCKFAGKLSWKRTAFLCLSIVCTPLGGKVKKYGGKIKKYKAKLKGLGQSYIVSKTAILFAAGGSYARMWNAQAKYYNVTDSHPEAPACARS
ncbi:MAG TPA: hypothetical protein DCZ91_06150 [Lachnospiraceae bacterium]|nr:hypothetical protein [Lachnospiraceae bacterium]